MRNLTTTQKTLGMALLILLAAALVPTHPAEARYARDGIFKQLDESNDKWFYVDKYNWEIAAPDKWTHMMGSMGLSTLLGQTMNKYLAAGLTLGLGIYKEYDDAFREGWSYRDIIADAVGVTASLTANKKYRILCDYDTEKVVLILNVTLK